MQTYKYVILGGGLTAGYAAQEFVKKGLVKGELCIISAEELLPYERPPLSKGFLAGKDSEGDLLINKPDFYLENGIVVKLKSKVRQVDLDQRILYSNRDSLMGFV